MANRSDILSKLREYEVQPPPEAFHNLLARLEAGSDDQQWLGAWQNLQELEVSPPPFMSVAIANAVKENPLFAALQEMVVAPPAGAFDRILREAAPREGKTPPSIAPIRKLYLRYGAIAAVLLLVIAGWGIYRFNHRPPAHPSPELVQTTIPAALPETAAVHPSSPAPGVTAIARYREYDNVKTENYFKNNRFTAGGAGMTMVDNDFIVTFASYQYEQLPAFLTEEEDSEMMIRLDQYSYFTISENMMSSLKRMYQRRSRGTPTRRARKEKQKLEQWKLADETWFDHKRIHNPLDPIDLAEFIFK
ncbi:hypothetical protein D3H65_19660 [Paraflavitalea soli]|uniref:Uncharacterized protein n=1 Tax=Paraflavitalea soli TaxID=2315862 RepID=A0A3B7MNI3_9BACT|nr:hypothetical protein [Paraflavitalea soli]AXY76064.1 hypothetical protein D3H65_19660 [Paraflavitalea soli]